MRARGKSSAAPAGAMTMRSGRSISRPGPPRKLAAPDIDRGTARQSHPRASRIDRLAHHVEEVCRADDVGDELVRRLLVDLPRRSLLHDTALAHDQHAVRQRQSLGLVVGHVHGGDPERALQAMDLGARAVAQLGVEVAERLVEQHGVGRLHDGPRHRDALLLAARQLGRLAIAEIAQADEPQRLSDPAGRSRSFASLRICRGKATFSNTVRCGQMA